MEQGTPIGERRKTRATLADKQPLEVYLRVRPLVKEEREAGQTECLQYLEPNTNQIMIVSSETSSSYTHAQTETETRFEFTRVFRPEDGQDKVFEQTGKPLAQQFVEGKNCLLFAYGNTNAGKTFTINGSAEEPGVLPRMMEMVFQNLEVMKKRSPKYSYRLVASYLEIYNETIIDLLAPGKEEKIEIKEDKAGTIYVTEIREEDLASPAAGKKLLEVGQQNRKVAETALNHDSSRSHSVFTLKLLRALKEGTAEEKRASLVLNKLSIVDLAGSERAKRTQNSGLRLKEAASINTSLMTFGRVVSILRENQNLPAHLQQVVPFRESKLTRLVQDFFLGSGRAMMMVNVTPAARDYDETLHVLRFSSLAKEVCTNSRPKKKPTVGPDTPLTSQNPARATPLLRSIRTETVTELKEEINDLKMKLIERESQMGRMEISIRADCARKLYEQLVEKELKSKRHIQRYETMIHDQYHQKVLIWSECQPEHQVDSLQESLQSLQEQLQAKDNEIKFLKKQLETEEAGKGALAQKLQLQLEMHEAMEHDHRDSWLKEKTQEYEAKTQNLQMQLSQQTLQVERLIERCKELESQLAGRSPIPKIVVTPPKGEREAKSTPLASSPASSFVNSSLSCDEEDALHDSDSMKDIALESPPRKDKRKRMFPKVLSAKKKLCTGKKKAKETKATKPKQQEPESRLRKSLSCPSLARLGNEVSRIDASKHVEEDIASVINDVSPIMAEVAPKKGRRSSLFFSSADEENTPENSPLPVRKPKALFSMRNIEEPAEQPKRAKKAEGKKKDKPKSAIQKKTPSRAILSRKAKAPSYLQNLKKPFQG